MSRLKSLWQAVIVALDLSSSGKWFVLSSLIGVVAGLGAIVFQVASQSVLHFTLVQFAGYAPAEPAGEHALFPHSPMDLSVWMIVAVMAAGGLVSGWIVYTFAPEAEGHGTDAAIEAFHQKRGFIRARIPLIKLVASAITIGTGGSGGREGPIAQIGAGFGSFLATRLNLSARDRRIMLAAGMGAGVGSIFRAPLAGALFAAEILYRDADLESDVIVPAAIASIVGYSVFSMFLPAGHRFMPLFGNHLEYSVGSPAELLPLTILAVFLVVMGAVYVKTFYGLTAQLKKLPVIPHLRPMLGAASAGLVGIGLYELFGRDQRALAVLSTGYGTLQAALQNADELGVGLLLAIAVFKILTTSLTIGSGGSGGVFGPSMVIGGCLGAAVGKVLNGMWPELVPHPEVYAIVGMAGFFAGCAHAPISTIIMVSEMTGDYKLLLPTMWVSTLCFVLSRRWTLYEKQVPSRLESPAHRGDFLVDVLEGIRVSDVPLRERKSVLESMSLHEILQLLPETRQNYFPVTDANQRLVGIFSTDDVRSYLYDDSIWHLAVARDVMTTKIISVRKDDDLNTAMRRFTELNLDEIPVLDGTDSRRLVGMLRRKDAISIYNRRVMERQKQAQDHA
ncbi:MAG: chloride channel protein [Planctomycetes bacterium]|nr:chloride channel protein [Planctomycetota bacterium]